MRILIVEDEESLALRIKNLLESEKYHAETAFNGEDGLELALTEEYDLLILDILLPWDRISESHHFYWIFYFLKLTDCKY